MVRKITASIVDMELKEVTFKRRVKKQDATSIMNYTYEVSGNNVKYECEFEFKLNTLFIKAKYFYEVVLYEIEDDEVEKFILNDEEEVFLPLVSKMSGLIMKITDEVTPFPFVASPEIWQIEKAKREE